MVRALLATCVVLLCVLPASASLMEDTIEPTGLTYQEDGGVHGDAPGTCDTVDLDRSLAVGGSQPANMLVEVDDESDAFAFTLEAADVGERVYLSLAAGLLVDRYDVSFDVRSPDCASSVFDPGSAYYDPAPATPYQPGPGFRAFDATVTGYACDPNQWKFLANQMGGIPAPATIYVEWTNGDHAYVPVDKSTPATVAMYLTKQDLGVTVARAVIVLPLAWQGQFKIASGPCGAVAGVPDEAPEISIAANEGYGEFTVQEAGTHVIIAYISRGTVEKTADTANETVGAVTETIEDPPTTVPVSCHRDLCSLALGDASYDLGSGYAA